MMRAPALTAKLAAMMVAAWFIVGDQVGVAGEPNAQSQPAVESGSDAKRGAVVELVRGTSIPGATPIPGGYGFFVSEHGHLITTYHQISDLSDIAVLDSAGAIRAADILHGDPVHDVALLKVRGRAPAHFDMASDRVEALSGDRVHLLRRIGSEHGDLSGRIIDSSQTQSFGPAVSVSVPTVPGDSGSAIVDEEGTLVGMARGGFTDASGSHTSHAIHLRSLRQEMQQFGDRRGMALGLKAGEGSTSTLLRVWGLDSESDAAAEKMFGVSLMHVVAAHGAPQWIEDLVRRGFKVGGVDAEGYAPLHVALGRFHFDAACALLSAGADANSATPEGATPLLIAASASAKEVLACLIKAGVNLQVKDTEGFNPLAYAIAYSDDGFVMAMLEAGATDPDILISIAATGRVALMPAALKSGADVNARRSDGTTALLMAIHYKHEDVLELLLGAGASANAADASGFTPLMVSTKSSVTVMKRLLDAGAEVDATLAGYRWTALMYAVQFATPEHVQMLLDKGASLDLKDASGRTALEFASRRTDVAGRAIAELLRTRGGVPGTRPDEVPAS
jgi:ankyrin repeat protein